MLNQAELEKSPNQIKDIFYAVLGEAFHFMDRMKVPTNHCFKKRYFALLQEAFFT